MVRFIIIQKQALLTDIIVFTFQYGQIYYDKDNFKESQIQNNLHSNMVRFIIIIFYQALQIFFLFTFQYGQIYYVLSIFQKPIIKILFTFQYGQIYYSQEEKEARADEIDLHSNMVRFIMHDARFSFISKIIFTFQYGQIYYPFFS